MLASDFIVVIVSFFILFVFFFFNDTATTEIYTLSLHDALPIFNPGKSDIVRDLYIPLLAEPEGKLTSLVTQRPWHDLGTDRKSTRLNSSHANISYAVFCLKKKKK